MSRGVVSGGVGEGAGELRLHQGELVPREQSPPGPPLQLLLASPGAAGMLSPEAAPPPECTHGQPCSSEPGLLQAGVSRCRPGADPSRPPGESDLSSI